jgi:hypothetical protein
MWHHTRQQQIHQLEERVDCDDGTDYEKYHAPFRREERIDSSLDEFGEAHCITLGH